MGTAVAWRCAQRGLTVTVVDPADQPGAWHTAAGMLAPASELQYGEDPLLRLGARSLAAYPAFVAEVAAASGLVAGYDAAGTLSVAWDSADLTTLRELSDYAAGLGVQTQWLTGTQLRQLEPALVPGLPAALLTPDHQVDPRRLYAGLRVAAERAGVRRLRARPSVRTDGGQVRGLRLAAAGGATGDGDTGELAGGDLDARFVVLAAGAWSALVPGVPESIASALRPVKGQTLRLRLPGAPRLSHVVRARIKGSPSYLVPRADGELVVGATNEEVGFDLTPRAGAVYELLRDAQSLLPELGEATLVESCVSLRPGSLDNAPLLGTVGGSGLIAATGHFRNGVLLTPVTAEAIAALLADGRLPDWADHFSPDRFSPDHLGSDGTTPRPATSTAGAA